MISKVKWNMFRELAIRIALWWMFLIFDYAEPFIREIKKNEVWRYQYPVTPSYIPAYWLWTVIFLTPAIFLITEYVITKKIDDPMRAALGITLSYGLTGSITTYVKVIIGRPRPDFYYRCFPDGDGDNYKNCLGVRRNYMDGRRSFPSGHASFAFSCMTFISLYLVRKLQLFDENNKGHSWQLCVCIMPYLIATGIAISRTCDYHHHVEDVIAGGLLGAVISYLCFKLYFSKISYNVASG